MTQIILTSKEKEKLCTMAGTIFPYRDWRFYDEQFIGHSEISAPRHYKKIKIHWLEFLIFHLTPKMVADHPDLHVNIAQLKKQENSIILSIYRYYYRHYER